MQGLFGGYRIGLAAGACAAAVLSGTAQQPDSAILARGLVDVERGRLVENAVVLIRGQRIVAAGSRADVPVPEGVTRIELPSAILLPGLIDGHVHLTLAGAPAANARATLVAGFTTVQDLGAAAYGNVRVRDSVEAGRIEGPRVIASGPWLGVSGGTCDFNGIGVRGADAFRKRVQEDVEHGVDLIKVCVTGWLADAVGNQAKYEISDEELRAAIDEAHARGKRVAVHALSEGGIAVAVRFGADLVAHGGFASAETVSVMKQRGIPQLPTLFSLSTAPADQFVALRTHMRQAVAAGLPIAFGTDAGVIPHGENAREFEHLVSIGLDNAAALRAATVSAAKAVGLPAEIGLLAPGRRADVIGVAANPLDDLKALQRVTFVMKDGKPVKLN